VLSIPVKKKILPVSSKEHYRAPSEECLDSNEGQGHPSCEENARLLVLRSRLRSKEYCQYVSIKKNLKNR
jgi:hypothetical protein